MGMEIKYHILTIVTESLSEIESGNKPLSAVIRKAIRVAKLRDDFYNLMWLEWEMIDLTDKTLKYEVLGNLKLHIKEDQFRTLKERFSVQWAHERKVKILTDPSLGKVEETYLHMGVGEIEEEIQHIEKEINNVKIPNGLHPADLYYVNNTNSIIKTMFLHELKEMKKVLERIRQRVYEFLISVEKELLFGQIYTDIFEQNRLYVEAKLEKISPESLKQFISAYRRIKDDEPESWAQALVSCRRLLKSLADALYPPGLHWVVGFDGKKHKLTDENYIARLWQFVYEKLSKSRSGNLLRTQIEEIGKRLDRLYDLINKGVHDNVSRFEVNQAIIQTYLIIGDILRVADGDVFTDKTG